MLNYRKAYFVWNSEGQHARYSEEKDRCVSDNYCTVVGRKINLPFKGMVYTSYGNCWDGLLFGLPHCPGQMGRLSFLEPCGLVTPEDRRLCTVLIICMASGFEPVVNDHQASLMVVWCIFPSLPLNTIFLRHFLVASSKIFLVGNCVAKTIQGQNCNYQLVNVGHNLRSGSLT